MTRLNFLIAAGALLAGTAVPALAHDRLSFGISFGPAYYGRHWGGSYYYPRTYYGPRYVYPRYYSYPAYGPPVYYAYSYPPPPREVVVERYVERVPAPPPERVRREPRPEPRASIAPPPRFEKMTLSATELFEFDQATLRAPQPKLDEIARVLIDNPGIGNVNIVGYTDRLGTDSYNQRLSQRRAEVVKGYLVSKGVPASRLNAIGRGESQPVVQCNQKDPQALIRCLEPNRRVEVEQITVEKRVDPVSEPARGRRTG
jgi:outer membrane protein OmpA-like peptidoglycan-associated protein